MLMNKSSCTCHAPGGYPHEPDCEWWDSLENPNYDPTPWCSYCGAKRKADCDCGPIAEND